MTEGLSIVVMAALGITFGSAAYSKIRRQSRFREVLKAYRIIPAALIVPTSVVITAGEAIAGCSFLLNIGVRYTAPFACFLGAAFVVAVSSTLRAGTIVPCMCSGAQHLEIVSTRTIIRLAFLVCAAGYLSAVVRARGPIPFQIFSEPGLIGLISAGLILEAMGMLFASMDILWPRLFTKNEVSRQNQQ